MAKISTGNNLLDSLLEGGYEKDIITTIYGPAGSGKTVLCMLCALSTARDEKKVIYIDTEGGFSIERLKQVAADYEKILDKIFFLKPTTFEHQKNAFKKLKDMVDDKIGLIIVDTIAMLYRLELGKSEDVYNVNRELGQQLSYLTQISREKNIPVLLTNQVYSNFENKAQVNIVGGDLLKYGSKCLIELQITRPGNRKIIIKKHRSLPPEKEALFTIIESGIISVKEEKKFKFF